MLGGLFHGLRDLIYPNSCLACKNRIEPGKIKGFVCQACQDKIEINLPPFCVYCGRRLDKLSLAKNICVQCQRSKFHFDRAFSPCKYDGVLKKLLQEFKYNGCDYLDIPLGKIMNDFIWEYRLPIEYMDFIVPIPLYKSRMREREFNQALLLSKEIAKEFNKEVLSGVLIRKKATRTQTELAPKERWINMEDGFSVLKPELIQGKNLLLVDDVLTTGATLSEAAKALKDSGAKIVFAMTLAN